MHDDLERGHADPSAKEQLEGRIGAVDKLVMMLAMMKTLMTQTPPSPVPPLAAGPSLPPSPAQGLGPPPMGASPGIPTGLPPGGAPPMTSPIGMGGPMGDPQLMLQQALLASKGLV